MQPSYDWLLFDADNTLFDFRQCERLALQAAIESIGLSFVDDHHAIYSEINHACWRDYELQKISKVELRQRRFRLFFAALEEKGDYQDFGRTYLERLSAAAVLIDGAAALLDRLRKHYRLALVTNGLKEVQRPRLRRAGLISLFEHIIVSDEIGHAKPHAAFFDYTFAQIGQPRRERVLIIGDNIHADIGGGLDYGIHACWYNPQRAAAVEDIRPTYEIQRLEELLQHCPVPG